MLYTNHHFMLQTNHHLSLIYMLHKSHQLSLNFVHFIHTPMVVTPPYKGNWCWTLELILHLCLLARIGGALFTRLPSCIDRGQQIVYRVHVLYVLIIVVVLVYLVHLLSTLSSLLSNLSSLHPCLDYTLYLT